MGEQHYDIMFSGELLPGFDAATVRANLSQLFKASPETIARLMGGGTHALKKNADHATALKYQAAVERAGARAELRPVTAAAPVAQPATAAPATAAQTTAPVPGPGTGSTPPSAALSIAPRGADLLAEHERRTVIAAQIDLSHIKLAPIFGAPPQTEQVPPPSPPDTSHLSVAAAGADLLPERSDAPLPAPPDTSALTLAAAGAPLAPEQDAPAPVIPDVSGITLAPPGTPLEELRVQREPVKPDISGLTLQP